VRVLEVPGVLVTGWFWTKPGAAIPILKSRHSALVSDSGRSSPILTLVIGERVRIKGPDLWTGMEGVLVRKKSNFRVVASRWT